MLTVRWCNQIFGEKIAHGRGKEGNFGGDFRSRKGESCSDLGARVWGRKKGKEALPLNRPKG